MGALNAGRLAAARALLMVERGAHAEDALAELAPADPADRALAWHLTLGVLRRRGNLDQALSQVVDRPLEALDPVALAVLRIGLYEVSLSRTARHAAVDQAVEACRAAGRPQASGFVNAVLRRVSERTLVVDPWADLPNWLRERWRAYGPWVSRLGEPAPLCGVCRDPGVYPDGLAIELAQAGGDTVPDAFVVRGARGTVEQLPGFQEGRWWVMDPASTRVADLALEAANGTAMRILDACSAPGGKSFRMAARGASVTAVDLSPDRIAKVSEGARRLHLEVPTLVHDWLTGPRSELGLYDVVLVDAPCTGLGTVRRHPEIRWARLPSDPGAMAIRQRDILRAASAHVREGGALVYSVCSPMEEEGAEVVGSMKGWRLVGAWASVPPQGDEDAFQVFTLRRG